MIDATGFDPWWFRKLLVGELAQALDNDRLRSFLAEHVDGHLSVPIHASRKELVEGGVPDECARKMVQSVSEKSELRMIVPMAAGEAQGPGFPNLTCLGLLANRVLEPFI